MVDAHCHLYDEKFSEIREDILSSVSLNDLYCITSGDNPNTSIKCVELAKNSKNIYATVGTHPHEAKNFKSDDLKLYEELSHLDKVVAIGEIGLDYHYEFSDRETQKRVLIEQINLANKLNMPCVFHVREATKDFLDIISSLHKQMKPSLVHSFNGSLDTAKILLGYGFYLSFNGIATFNNAKNVLDIIAYMPMDRIIIETDSPYLAPVPHRGEVNRPEYVKLVAEVVSRIKGLTTEEVIIKTQENAERLFNIKFGVNNVNG